MGLKFHFNAICWGFSLDLPDLYAKMRRLEKLEMTGFKSFLSRTELQFGQDVTVVVGPNGCGKSNIGDALNWVIGEQSVKSLRGDRMEDVIFNGSEGRKPLGMAEVSLHFRNLLSEGHGVGPGNGQARGDRQPANGNGNAAAAGQPAAPPVPGDHKAPIAKAAEIAAPSAEGSALTGAEPEVLRFTAIEEIPEQVVVTRRIYRSGESEYILNGERCRLKDIQDLLAKTDIGSRLYSTIEQGKIDQVLAAKPKDRRAMF